MTSPFSKSSGVFIRPREHRKTVFAKISAQKSVFEILLFRRPLLPDTRRHKTNSYRKSCVFKRKRRRVDGTFYEGLVNTLECRFVIRAPPQQFLTFARLFLKTLPFSTKRNSTKCFPSRESLLGRSHELTDQTILCTNVF